MSDIAYTYTQLDQQSMDVVCEMQPESHKSTKNIKWGYNIVLLSTAFDKPVS